MKVLVINAGSSSLKYQLIDMAGEKVLAKGNCERIGIDGFVSHTSHHGAVVKQERPFADHRDAFRALVELLTSGETAVISGLKDIAAVGHRALNGCEKYPTTTIITDEVIHDIAVTFRDLGPLHNPPQAAGMQACRDVFGPEIPMVAVFDTSFHQTMPEKAYIFGIPYEYYKKYNIRRYGFHGTSHRYISNQVANNMNRPIEEMKIVTCHLGNGSSIAAVKHGKCIDTSMGFTPLDGIIMGTRAGGIDPSIVTFLMEKEGLSPKQMDDILNKESGFLGLSGVSSDSRELVAAANENNHRAQLTCDIVRYQIKKYIGSYAAAMGGIDAVAFSGGIGENSIDVRKDACSDLEFLGIKLDESKNREMNQKEADISAEGASVRTWIINTNEELVIARETRDIVAQ